MDQSAAVLRGLKLILSIFVAASLQQPVLAEDPLVLPCRANDRKCAKDAMEKNPVRQMPYWKPAFEKPVERRLGHAPSELVLYLNLDNTGQGFPNQPRAAAIPEDFLKDVNDAMAELPPRVKQLIDRKLAGIYFVRDLGGTGYTDYIHSGQGTPVAGFTVLDMDVLAQQTANAWATWKENSPFKADAKYRLETDIEDQGQDNRKHAIQYILLHELGHIVSIDENIHPRWDQWPAAYSSVDHYPFAQLSWEIVNASNGYASLFEKEFPLRKDVVYYFGAKLNGGQMVEVYEQLERTNYPTLYAATSPGDDFAESFASYVHTVLLKRPLEIRLYRNGKLAKTYKSCWEEKRCAAKRKILEELLKP
jgi:hypothetical protein